MLTLPENVVILVLAIIAALMLMALINWIWPARTRYGQEDLVGWQLSILATTHAVILGFMLYAEWTGFQAAQLNVELEANALQNLYRLAEGLPAPERASIERDARAYAQAVLADDWPDMAAGRIPQQSHRINEALWKTLSSTRTSSPQELAAEDHALTELSALTQFTRIRVLQSKTRLPAIFWCVLVVGGVLTIASVAMFGSRVYRLHAFQVVSHTLLITLAMLTIADLNRPFQGWVRVDSYGFQRSLGNMHELP